MVCQYLPLAHDDDHDDGAGVDACSSASISANTLGWLPVVHFGTLLMAAIK